MDEAEWWQVRRYLDSELGRVDASSEDASSEDFHNGQWVALMKIKGRFFLTDSERLEMEKTRREMFG